MRKERVGRRRRKTQKREGEGRSTHAGRIAPAFRLSEGLTWTGEEPGDHPRKYPRRCPSSVPARPETPF